MAITTTILCWQRIPYAADEQPNMPTYRIAGTITGVPSARPDNSPRAFIGDVSVEIDGFAVAYKHLAGFHVPTDGLHATDAWGALLQAMAANEGLTAEMSAETERYYAG